MYLLNKIFMKMIRMSNAILFLSTILFLALSSLVMYVLEPDTFHDPFNAFWYVMTTVTTVGYGDFYPQTTAGKLYGMLLFVVGIGLIGIVISKVVDGLFLYQRKKEAGRMKYRGRRHFVIIGWNNNAEVAVREILASDPKPEIVLIDRLPASPFTDERLHYVQGNPVLRETLEMANIGEARSVFIFSGDTTEHGLVLRDTSYIDGKSLLVATAIERNFDHIYTVVEIMERENIDNFRHAQVDEFILGREVTPLMAVRAAFHPGSSRLVAQLLSRQYGDDLYEIRKRPEWRTYRDAFRDLLAEGATLLSDGEQMDINRRLDEPIADGARLFVICDKSTYLKLGGA